MRIRSSNGWSHFVWLWLGQVISLTGSGVTSFALGVWVYRETGSITQFSLISLFAVLPGVLISPLAGVLADTWDRRYLILISDTGAAACTLVVGTLYQRGTLGIEHIYMAAAASSIFGAIQWPAWLALITGMIKKNQLGRGNGMLQFGQAAAGLSAPLLAGTIGVAVGMEAIFFLDFGSFLFAVITLLFIRTPKISAEARSKAGSPGLFYGVRFIFATKGLGALLMLNMLSNFLMAMVEVLGRPMILNGHSEAALGSLLATGGLGMLGGGLLMGVWGGPKRKFMSLIGFQMGLGICLVLMGFSSSLIAFGSLIFLFYFCLPISTGSNMAIWQREVPDEVRGRVFAAQRAVNWSMRPLAYVSAGPMVERCLLPVLKGGPLAGTFAAKLFLKSGGIGLMFVLMGLLTIAVSGLSWLNPKLRWLDWKQAEAVYA